MIPFTPPQFQKAGFNCPHCNAYANQVWLDVFIPNPNLYKFDGVKITFCSHCNKYTLWNLGAMVYPDSTGIPLPNADLEKEIQADYNEARSIIEKSPRGAAALLRLAIQKICRQLGGSGENINTDIANLVKKGLPIKIQQALDIVRVAGNNAVHPGQIDLNDNKEIALKLFELINLIAQVMITQPNEVKRLYESLPETTKAAIKDRDKPALS